jgi:hypothetical protein
MAIATELAAAQNIQSGTPRRLVDKAIRTNQLGGSASVLPAMASWLVQDPAAGCSGRPQPHPYPAPTESAFTLRGRRQPKQPRMPR